MVTLRNFRKSARGDKLLACFENFEMLPIWSMFLSANPVQCMPVSTFPLARKELSGPLNRLNAILSLLQPLDRYRTPSAIVHAQYDWTTGVPDNGNDWRKFRAVPRSYPLRSLVLYFV